MKVPAAGEKTMDSGVGSKGRKIELEKTEKGI